MSADGRPGVVVLGVPMAIGVRDVLRTDAFKVLVDAGLEIHIVTHAAENPDFREEFGGPRVHFHRLRSPRSRLFDLVEGAVAKLHVLIQSLRCDTVRIMVAPRLEASRGARLIRALVGATGRWGQDLMLAAGRLLVRMTLPPLYGDLFREHRPDLVVGTRVLTMAGPRAAEASRYLDRYLLVDARRHGIRVAALVASWDNLTSQGFFPCRVDRVVVWNRMMRDECVEIHGIPAERVVVAGAPQHDVYAGAPYSDRADFLTGLGLDPERPVVVYTTQTEGIVPDEPRIAETVQRVLAGRPGPAPQLLVRVHQLDRTERYAHLAALDGVALDHAGEAAFPEFPDRAFDRAALRHLADTLAHADVVVNTASSISIDAAAVASPVVVVAYDPGGQRPYGDSVTRFYDYTHQRHVLRSGGVRVARSDEELAQALEAYLEDPELDAEGRRRLVAEQCHAIDGASGSRVGAALLADPALAPAGDASGESASASPGAAVTG